jgi:Asp-tRNA(Asn)/Glu-tRNA(Gln) amidotransferase A subunit family amidase
LRLSAFGLGSDSLGSARIPAAFCGVYSFKGTGKRLSTYGRLGLTGGLFGGFKDITTSIGPFAAHLDDIIAVEKQGNLY